MYHVLTMAQIKNLEGRNSMKLLYPRIYFLYKYEPESLGLRTVNQKSFIAEADGCSWSRYAPQWIVTCAMKQLVYLVLVVYPYFGSSNIPVACIIHIYHHIPISFYTKIYNYKL